MHGLFSFELAKACLGTRARRDPQRFSLFRFFAVAVAAVAAIAVGGAGAIILFSGLFEFSPNDL